MTYILLAIAGGVILGAAIVGVLVVAAVVKAMFGFWNSF